MADVVEASEIERIVGVRRHPKLHYGRAVSSDTFAPDGTWHHNSKVYILHSQDCYDRGEVATCAWTQALDRAEVHIVKSETPYPLMLTANGCVLPYAGYPRDDTIEETLAWLEEEGVTSSFRCPRCGRRSYHPKDVEEGYCGQCRAWTAEPVFDE